MHAEEPLAVRCEEFRVTLKARSSSLEETTTRHDKLDKVAPQDSAQLQDIAAIHRASRNWRIFPRPFLNAF